MININKIPMDFETRNKILSKITPSPPPGQPEMNLYDSAFLCGIIKKFQPKKILEIGVCGGGSTAIILQCLEDIGQKYIMKSIDIAEKFPRDEKLETGFIGKQAKKQVFIPNKMKGSHEFILGTTLPFVIEKIGDEIDFVMLDTAHVLPGEILDFLVVLPYLKSDAIVCLHDVAWSQYSFKDIHQHATGILFSSVVADKFLNFILDNTLQFRYPNIAAFQINSDTMKDIANVFLALIPRWRYLPADKDFLGYAETLMRIYPAEIFAIFQEAARMNIQNLMIEQQAESEQNKSR